MIGRMDTAIRVALDRWEPRIDVMSIDFDLSRASEGTLEIDIGYRVRATSREHNLVYPFYVIPAEELA
jgi:phage baseplate assembly protein W